VYWFIKALVLRRQFNGFLTARTMANRSQAAIKKLTFYMTISSVCMLICSSSWLLLLLPYLSGEAVYDIGTTYTLLLVFVYSRIGFSYAQIMAIKPNPQSRSLRDRVQPLTRRVNHWESGRDRSGMRRPERRPSFSLLAPINQRIPMRNIIRKRSTVDTTRAESFALQVPVSTIPKEAQEETKAGIVVPGASYSRQASGRSRKVSGFFGTTGNESSKQDIATDSEMEFIAGSTVSELTDEMTPVRLSSTEMFDIQFRAKALVRMLEKERSGL